MATRLTRSFYTVPSTSRAFGVHQIHQLDENHKSPHDYEKSWGELTFQVGDPKKCRKNLHARESLPNEAVQICILRCAPTWNRRFVSQCCDIPITVQADQESAEESARRLSRPRRLPVFA
jgi:hypothetical protein